MSPDARRIAAGLPAARVRGPRAPGRLDGRSAVAKRIRARVKGFTGKAGGSVDPEDVRRAAEMLTIAEKMRLQVLAGEHVDPLKLALFENAAARAVRELGLAVKPPPSLDEVIV